MTSPAIGLQGASMRNGMEKNKSFRKDLQISSKKFGSCRIGDAHA
jgi:hypothetical protein